MSALAKYGRHLDECKGYTPGWGQDCATPCTCGFAEALADDTAIDITTYAPKRGDVLVIRALQPITDAAVIRLIETAKQHLPECRVVVLDNDLQVAVIRPEL